MQDLFINVEQVCKTVPLFWIYLRQWSIGCSVSRITNERELLLVTRKHFSIVDQNYCTRTVLYVILTCRYYLRVFAVNAFIHAASRRHRRRRGPPFRG